MQELSFVIIMCLLALFYYDYEYRKIKNRKAKEALVIIAIILIVLNIILEIVLIIKNGITSAIEAVKNLLKKKEEAKEKDSKSGKGISPEKPTVQSDNNIESELSSHRKEFNGNTPKGTRKAMILKNPENELSRLPKTPKAPTNRDYMILKIQDENPDMERDLPQTKMELDVSLEHELEKKIKKTPIILKKIPERSIPKNKGDLG